MHDWQRVLSVDPERERAGPWAGLPIQRAASTLALVLILLSILLRTLVDEPLWAHGLFVGLLACVILARASWALMAIYIWGTIRGTSGQLWEQGYWVPLQPPDWLFVLTLVLIVVLGFRYLELGLSPWHLGQLRGRRRSSSEPPGSPDRLPTAIRPFAGILVKVALAATLAWSLLQLVPLRSVPEYGLKPVALRALTVAWIVVAASVVVESLLGGVGWQSLRPSQARIYLLKTVQEQLKREQSALERARERARERRRRKGR